MECRRPVSYRRAKWHSKFGRCGWRNSKWMGFNFRTVEILEYIWKLITSRRVIIFGFEILGGDAPSVREISADDTIAQGHFLLPCQRDSTKTQVASLPPRFARREMRSTDMPLVAELRDEFCIWFCEFEEASNLEHAHVLATTNWRCWPNNNWANLIGYYGNEETTCPLVLWTSSASNLGEKMYNRDQATIESMWLATTLGT